MWRQATLNGKASKWHYQPRGFDSPSVCGLVVARNASVKQSHYPGTGAICKSCSAYVLGLIDEAKEK